MTTDRTIIRMDGTTRKNAGVGLGDIITLRPAKLKKRYKGCSCPFKPTYST